MEPVVLGPHVVEGAAMARCIKHVEQDVCAGRELELGDLHSRRGEG